MGVDIRIIGRIAVKRPLRFGDESHVGFFVGAGDQGIMFGYACRETDVLMPAPIYFSHAILRSLAEARHSGAEPRLLPDAKSQVTLQYSDGKPVRAVSIVVSTQHHEDLDQAEVREIVRPHVELGREDSFMGIGVWSEEGSP